MRLRIQALLIAAVVLAPLQAHATSATVAQISAGNAYACAVTTAGDAKCWGENTWRRIGDGTRHTRLVPVDVSNLSSGVSQIAAGYEHTCVV